MGMTDLFLWEGGRISRYRYECAVEPPCGLIFIKWAVLAGLFASSVRIRKVPLVLLMIFALIGVCIASLAGRLGAGWLQVQGKTGWSRPAGRGQWMIEGLGMLAGLGLAASPPGQDFALPVLLVLALACILAAIAVLDFQHGLIPDQLTLAIAGLGGAWIWTTDRWDFGLVFALALFALGAFLAGPYSRWRGRDMLGWGDVKFLGAAGLWLTPATLPAFLVLSGVCGALFGTVWSLSGRGKESPFAPALCLSLLICVVVVLTDYNAFPFRQFSIQP
jgi:leader peptidase (prepilin peptidase) / N-methyltransferase